MTHRLHNIALFAVAAITGLVVFGCGSAGHPGASYGPASHGHQRPRGHRAVRLRGRDNAGVGHDPEDAGGGHARHAGPPDWPAYRVPAVVPIRQPRRGAPLAGQL